MSQKVAIVAPGEMGSFIGSTLVSRGAVAETWTRGRSEASLARARNAGMALTDDLGALVSHADFILSVVPPDAALKLAEQMRTALAQSAHKPVYVDCNAVAPQTVKRASELIEGTGCAFVDAGLFGGPTSGKPGVVLYASGAHAADLLPLGEFGLSVRIIDGPVGAASAMKLSFAAINKGFTAVAVLALLAALQNSSGEALLEQLAETQPGILQYISRFVPAMFPKSYRWAPEMEEIAVFLQDDPQAHDIYEAFAEVYRRVARDVAPREHGMVPALRDFCTEASNYRVTRSAQA